MVAEEEEVITSIILMPKKMLRPLEKVLQKILSTIMKPNLQEAEVAEVVEEKEAVEEEVKDIEEMIDQKEAIEITIRML